MGPLERVGLAPVMKRTSGIREIVIGLIDGPVVIDHPDLVGENVRNLGAGAPVADARSGTAASAHGTFVAGMLCAKRTSFAPAICPNCSLLVRPIFAQLPPVYGALPSATPETLAAAIIEAVDAGAHILNLSVELSLASSWAQRALTMALDYALTREVIVVVAAGNQGSVGSSVMTQRPWVIPVTACDLHGQLLPDSNLGHSIGKRGLRAPGDRILSLDPTGPARTSSGTSVAAPFVTGAVALLRSAFPAASAGAVLRAVTQADVSRRRTVTPP